MSSNVFDYYSGSSKGIPMYTMADFEMASRNPYYAEFGGGSRARKQKRRQQAAMEAQLRRGGFKPERRSPGGFNKMSRNASKLQREIRAEQRRAYAASYGPQEMRGPKAPIRPVYGPQELQGPPLPGRSIYDTRPYNKLTRTQNFAKKNWKALAGGGAAAVAAAGLGAYALKRRSDRRKAAAEAESRTLRGRVSGAVSRLRGGR
jgi:hypothetical protein